MTKISSSSATQIESIAARCMLQRLAYPLSHRLACAGGAAWVLMHLTCFLKRPE